MLDMMPLIMVSILLILIAGITISGAVIIIIKSRNFDTKARKTVKVLSSILIVTSILLLTNIYFLFG